MAMAPCTPSCTLIESASAEVAHESCKSPCRLLSAADGTDAYAYAKKIGRFRLIKRTEGVSSTDIVGRMLMCTRVNPKLRQVTIC